MSYVLKSFSARRKQFRFYKDSMHLADSSLYWRPYTVYYIILLGNTIIHNTIAAFVKGALARGWGTEQATEKSNG